MPDAYPQQPDALTEELAVRWTRAQPAVMSFIGSVIRDYNDAEDVLQEVAAGAARAYASYDRDRPFLGWVMGIARHKVADYQRKHYRDRLVFSTEAVERISDAFELIADESNDRRQALDVCVKKLHERGQQILELRYTHGLPPASIGDRVGMSRNAVTVSLHRIRRALSDCVQRQIGKGGSS